MNIIGLTGGIATGKSTVSAILQSAGATIIDADKIARNVVQKGLPGYQQIVDHFGNGVLHASGDLNRGALADVIFRNAEQKKALDRIVHPLVKAETTVRLNRIAQIEPQALVFLDVPLLFEAGMDKGLAEIIVVYAPESIQLQRLMQRDHLSQNDARYRIQSQMPIEQKRSRATIVIDNSGSIAETRAITLNVYTDLKQTYLPAD